MLIENVTVSPAHRETWERIRAKLMHVDAGCWLWSGLLGAGGYGMIRVNNKTSYVHRVAFTLLRGDIPAKHELHHICETPACANPWHLEAVTRREHMLRTPNSVYCRAQRATHCPKGHALTPDNLYVSNLKSGGIIRRCRRCTREQQNAAYAARPPSGWAYDPENHPKAKLTHAQVQEIRALYAAGGWTQEGLGARYGVSQAALGYIVRGQTWKVGAP